MHNTQFNSIVLFGTTFGIDQSLPFFPTNSIKAIVAPSNRPLQVSEIKKTAIENKINFLEQPKKNSSDFRNFYDEIKLLKPDLIWSNSYSMIIPSEILELTGNNAINIHWSLLPKNQGPNPIQWSLIKDEKETGVTFHLMDDKIDSGEMIYQDRVQITETDTWLSVFKKLESLSLAMHEKYMQSILNNDFKKQKQLPEKATTNKRLTPDYPLIDFSRLSDREIFNLIRAQVDPLPGAYLKNSAGEKIHFNKYKTLKEVAALRNEYSK